MFRISVTQVESFRYYLENEYVTKSNFIDSLLKKSEPSKFMLMGTAYHSILETPQKYYNKQQKNFICNGFEFKEIDMLKSIDNIDYNFPFEVKQVKQITTTFGIVNLVAKVDQLCYGSVVENKTCWNGFNWEKYYLSLQRKFYADIFGVDIVKYNVFEMNDTIKDGIKLKDIHQFKFYTDKVEIVSAYKYLNQFLDFLDAENLLTNFIDNKIKVAS